MLASKLLTCPLPTSPRWGEEFVNSIAGLEPAPTLDFIGNLANDRVNAASVEGFR